MCMYACITQLKVHPLKSPSCMLYAVCVELSCCLVMFACIAILQTPETWRLGGPGTCCSMLLFICDWFVALLRSVCCVSYFMFGGPGVYYVRYV